MNAADHRLESETDQEGVSGSKLSEQDTAGKALKSQKRRMVTIKRHFSWIF